MSLAIDEVAARFSDFRRNGAGFKAVCPCHDDQKPSLEINPGNNGGIVIFCPVCGKGAEYIIASGKVRLTMADLMPQSNGHHANGNGSHRNSHAKKPNDRLYWDAYCEKKFGKLVDAYDYTDASGNLIKQVCRTDQKQFPQRQRDAAGKWKLGVKGLPVVVYHLHKLAKADRATTLFIPEGEKDVHTLEAWGLLATCNDGGAEKFTREHAEHCRGFRCVLLEDNDEKGRSHVAIARSHLQAVGNKIYRLLLPDLPPKGDVTDWKEAGGTKEEFLELLASLDDEEPAEPLAALTCPLCNGTVFWHSIYDQGPRCENCEPPPSPALIGGYIGQDPPGASASEQHEPPAEASPVKVVLTESLKALEANPQEEKKILSGTIDALKKISAETVEQPPSFRALAQNNPTLRREVICGLLREGETMNLIAPPKYGKSFLVTDLALTVVGGGLWLGKYRTEAGNVLIVDNELHPETSASRIPKVAEAKGLTLDAYGDKLFVLNLRGQLVDINGMARIFSQFKPGDFQLVVIDAMYRALPPNTDENDNGAMAAIYNTIDGYSLSMKCAFALIHHASKGNQAGKAVTDVGAGAGAQSRATDTHLILRQHEEPGVVVLDGVVRSFAPVDPICLRWDFPTWSLAEGLDPSKLKPLKPAKAKSDKAAEPGRPNKFAEQCEKAARVLVELGPLTQSKLRREINVSSATAKEILAALEEDGTVEAFKDGKFDCFRLVEMEGGTSGTE